MVFSELLLCACGRKGHLDEGFRMRPLDSSLSTRQKQAAAEKQRLEYILSQIGLENLQKFHSPSLTAPPLHDLPVALALLDQMLQQEWQGDGARITASKALAHAFFGEDASVAASRVGDEEQRLDGVRRDLQRLVRVRKHESLCINMESFDSILFCNICFMSLVLFFVVLSFLLLCSRPGKCCTRRRYRSRAVAEDRRSVRKDQL